MSDESAPPPLRLKPRAQPPVMERRPDVVPAVSNVAEASLATATAVENAPPKLRVKPRLAEPVAPVLVEPAAAPQKAPAPSMPAPAPAPVPPPASAVTEAAPADVAKFKLKPKMPATPVVAAPTIPPTVPAAIPPPPSPVPQAHSPAPAPTVPPPPRPPGFGGSPANLAESKLESGILAPIEEDASAPKGVSVSTMSDLQISESPFLPTTLVGAGQLPPFPVVSPSAPAGGLPRPAHVGAAGQIFGGPAVEDVKPEDHPGFKLGIAIAAVLFAIVVGVGIFFGWKHFRPAPEKAAVAPAAPIAPPPAPATASAEPAAALPDSLAKIREFAEAQRIQEQARIDALATGSDIPGRTTSPGLSPSAKVPSAGTTMMDAPVALAPGVTASNPSAAISDASPAFRTFVANVKITGVFQGDPPRAFIDGRTVRAGEFVNASLGISFDSVDPEKKQIVFKDRNGVTVTRRY